MIMANRSYRSFAYESTERRTVDRRSEDLRIVHIVQHLRPGGIEALALDFLNAGFHRDSTIISLEGTFEENARKWPRLQDHRDRLIFLNKRDGFRPGLIAALSRRLSEIKPDAVHTHHIGPLFYGCLAARLAGIERVIHTEHDAWHLTDPQAAKLVKRMFTLARPTVVADASLVARNLASATGVRPTVIRNGIDISRFEPTDKILARVHLGFPKDAILIGTAGRLTKVKNQTLALEALARLPRKSSGRDLFLVIAGDGEDRAFLELRAKKLGICDRVKFVGHTDDMVAFYNALDVFFLCSKQEGLPLSLLEAQSCNVPVAATRVGACEEAVCPSTGRLIEPDSPDDLAAAILVLSKLSKVKNPRNFVLDTGDARAMHRAYAGLYR